MILAQSRRAARNVAISSRKLLWRLEKRARRPAKLFIRLLVNGEQRDVTLLSRERNSVRFSILGGEYFVEFPAEVPSTGGTQKKLSTKRGTTQAGSIQSGEFLQVIASIPGVICEVLVCKGSNVEAGGLLLRLEAMNMQNGTLLRCLGPSRIN